MKRYERFMAGTDPAVSKFVAEVGGMGHGSSSTGNTILKVLILWILGYCGINSPELIAGALVVENLGGCAKDV